jgi:hypothetical protein
LFRRDCSVSDPEVADLIDHALRGLEKIQEKEGAPPKVAARAAKA